MWKRCQLYGVAQQYLSIGYVSPGSHIILFPRIASNFVGPARRDNLPLRYCIP